MSEKDPKRGMQESPERMRMNHGENHLWRQAPPDWREEIESEDGWKVSRKYRTERCSSCPARRFTRPVGSRRGSDADSPPKENRPLSLAHLNASKWSLVETLIPRLRLNRFEVEALLRIWAEEGWIEVEETGNDQQSWSIVRARLSPLVVQQHTRDRAVHEIEREQTAVEALARTLRGWEQDAEEARSKHRGEGDIVLLLDRMCRLFEEQERSLASGVIVPLPASTMQAGGSPHQRWVSLLRGILDLLANPRTEHERVFSARWLADSKALQKEREALEAYVSLEGGLQRLGLVKHTPVVLSCGDWQATCNGSGVSGREGYSFTATPADMIALLQDMQVNAEMLLIIENQTPFEILVQPKSRDPRVLYLYGAGFPGLAQRAMVARLLRAKPPLPWSVWTDYDVGGVGIQQYWQSWSFQERLHLPRAHRWTREDLALCTQLGIPLTSKQKELLLRKDHFLARVLCECGYRVEQEAILSAYPTW